MLLNSNDVIRTSSPFDVRLLFPLLIKRTRFLAIRQFTVQEIKHSIHSTDTKTISNCLTTCQEQNTCWTDRSGYEWNIQTAVRTYAMRSHITHTFWMENLIGRFKLGLVIYYPHKKQQFYLDYMGLQATKRTKNNH